MDLKNASLRKAKSDKTKKDNCIEKATGKCKSEKGKHDNRKKKDLKNASLRKAKMPIAKIFLHFSCPFSCITCCIFSSLQFSRISPQGVVTSKEIVVATLAEATA